MSALPVNPADILGKARKEAVDALRVLLDAMGAGADDAFFDRSQNAPADEQGLFFEAMRELRLKKQALVDAVLAGVDDDFQVLGGAASSLKKEAPKALTLETMTLLDDDDLDISVAFSAMVTRCRDGMATDLDHLRQRYAKLLARDLEADELPLHPAKFCEHFRKAAEAITLPLKARLILFKLFERKVLDELREVVAAINTLLAGAGVLPEIKSAKPRPTPSGGGAGGSRGGKGGGSSARGKSRADDDDDDGEDEDDGDDDQGGGRRRGRSGGGGDFAAMSGAFAELLALARGAMVPGGGAAGMVPAGAASAGMVPAGMAPGAMFPGGVMPAGAEGGFVPAGMMIPLSELTAGQVPVMYAGQPMVGGRVVQTDVPMQVVAPSELAALLTRLQHMQPMLAAPVGQTIEHADLSPVDVQSSLSGLIQEESAAAPRALDGADNDVINLVSMLFDFILDDAELPPEMKALIGRLQIPLLKVSLLDKSFFDRDDHPARRLVNALARAGIGWTRDADDGLYAKIEAVVYSVLNEFTDDVSLFERLESELAAFISEREKRMALIETRLRDREEGQAKTAQAQVEVRNVIAARIAGRKLPPEVLAMVQDAWQRVLYMTAIRDGIDSEAWTQRVKVLEVMVWCAQKHEKEDSRTRQRGLVPRLMVSLRRGLEAVGFDSVRAEAMLTAVQTVLDKLGGGGDLRTVRVVAEQQTAAQSAARDAAPPGNPSDALQVVRRNEDEVVIATAAAPVPEPVVEGLDERWLQTAENLPPGTWIEFVDSEHNFKVRGKIAAKIRAQNKFIFVNGRGVKISEKTTTQLAQDLQSGVARLINDNALFDRALETMIGRLRSGVPG